MEKHISKKIYAGVLALSAGFLLASCDPVSALPSNYNNDIIFVDDNGNNQKIEIVASYVDDKGKTHNLTLDAGNNLGTLYDSITSERNAKVVEKILSKIAEGKFGTYSEYLEAHNDASKVAAFVAKYPEFFGTDATEAAAKFEAFDEDVTARISEYFYKEVTSGSYNDDLGRFSEEKLYNSHRYELYDLHQLVSPADDAVINNNFYVTKELNKYKMFDTSEDNYLKGTYYNLEDGKRGYIEEKVYPDILRDKLVEDYIYKNNPSSLGRAYGRQVNYVKVSYDSEPLLTGKLMENFAKAKIETANTDEQINFELVANAVKGFSTFNKGTYLVDNIVAKDLTKAAAAPQDLFDLLTATYGAPVLDAPGVEGNAIKVDFDADDKEADYKLVGTETIQLIPEGCYYKDTKLGKILVEYKKAIKAEDEGRFPADENKAALESFTSDGKTKEYGLLQKLISLSKEDYTTDGWYVKNGGLTELPSALRDRLFNIRVANTLDITDVTDPKRNVDEGVEDGKAIGDYATYTVDPKDSTKKKEVVKYLRSIYGHKVILSSVSLSYEKDHYNYIYHDRDAKAFYICEVLEAPSTAKLNPNQATAYKKADDTVDTAKIENISRQVAKILGTKDSYIKDAYTEYLNKYTFYFYDTSLRDYFKSEYPDLDQFAE